MTDPTPARSWLLRLIERRRTQAEMAAQRWLDHRMYPSYGESEMR